MDCIEGHPGVQSCRGSPLLYCVNYATESYLSVSGNFVTIVIARSICFVYNAPIAKFCSDFDIAEIAVTNFYAMIAEIEVAHSMITVTAVRIIVESYRGVSS